MIAYIGKKLGILTEERSHKSGHKSYMYVFSIHRSGLKQLKWIQTSEGHVWLEFIIFQVKFSICVCSVSINLSKACCLLAFLSSMLLLSSSTGLACSPRNYSLRLFPFSQFLQTSPILCVSISLHTPEMLRRQWTQSIFRSRVSISCEPKFRGVFRISCQNDPILSLLVGIDSAITYKKRVHEFYF